jgi:hypothetical protein
MKAPKDYYKIYEDIEVEKIGIISVLSNNYFEHSNKGDSLIWW